MTHKKWLLTIAILGLGLRLAVALIAIPAYAQTMPDASVPQPQMTALQTVRIGVYVVDFNRFSVADGTYDINFYLSLTSDTPVSLSDLEIMNGHVTSVDTIQERPARKITGSLPP
jgi:hypothetical protein